jgi:hypothetical protein
MKRTITTRTLTIVAATLLSTALAAAPSMAQVPPPVNTAYGEHHPYVEGFDNYLDKHPEVRGELSRDPRLIDNPAYLSKHPELRDYMHEHPREAAAFRSHPDRFMHREHVYNRGVRRWDRHHAHPEVN